MLNSFKLFRVPIRLLILLFPLAVCGLHLIRGFSFFFPFLFLVLVRGELATWETVFGVFSLSCQGVCKEFRGGVLWWGSVAIHPSSVSPQLPSSS